MESEFEKEFKALEKAVRTSPLLSMNRVIEFLHKYLGTHDSEIARLKLRNDEIEDNEIAFLKSKVTELENKLTEVIKIMIKQGEVIDILNAQLALH